MAWARKIVDDACACIQSLMQDLISMHARREKTEMKKTEKIGRSKQSLNLVFVLPVVVV